MTLIAETYAENIGERPADLFSHQFALVPSGRATFPGFLDRTFGTRTLLHCPNLEVAILCDAEGHEVGYCLGIAVDSEGFRITSGRRLGAVRSDVSFWDEVETLAVGLAGRWLLLILNGVEARIYGDATGMYNCVYDPVGGVVGSTLLLSLLREIEESDEVDYTLTMSQGMRLPFGRTRDAHAKRLGGNHFLRLDEWSETRFWPKPGDFAEAAPGDAPSVIAAIRDRLAAVIAGIVKSTPTAIAVSGGADSRNLVAAGRDSLAEVRRFFSWTHSFNSRTDYRSAAMMMKTLGHEVERHVRAPEPWTESELAQRNARYGCMTGFAVGPHHKYNIKLASELPAGEVILTGNVMEALRAANWKSATKPRRNPLVFGLKRCLFVGGSRFDADFIEKWLPEYRRWLAGLPEDAQEKFIDVLFAEHYLPNLGTTFFSYQDNFYMCPFNDRRLVQLCANLPLAYRFSHQANRDFLALAAPELVDVPFATDIRRINRRAS